MKPIDPGDQDIRDCTVRTPTEKGVSNYDDEDSNSKNDSGWRDGLNLKIQRQAKVQSAKLWKLLSPLPWEKPKNLDRKEFEQNWNDTAHNNQSRTWASFANHEPWNPEIRDWIRIDDSVSLESWHDFIHGLVGTGRSSGHMGNPTIAAVGHP